MVTSTTLSLIKNNYEDLADAMYEAKLAAGLDGYYSDTEDHSEWFYWCRDARDVFKRDRHLIYHLLDLAEGYCG